MSKTKILTRKELKILNEIGESDNTEEPVSLEELTTTIRRLKKNAIEREIIPPLTLVDKIREHQYS